MAIELASSLRMLLVTHTGNVLFLFLLTGGLPTLFIYIVVNKYKNVGLMNKKMDDAFKMLDMLEPKVDELNAKAKQFSADQEKAKLTKNNEPLEKIEEENPADPEAEVKPEEKIAEN